MRFDIQVLRAFAVAIVVVYHLAPSRLSGGFTGVDVFFVISGFLITTHLVEVPPSSVTDLLSFWGRRIRRLLPASLTVLIVTAVASYLWLPPTLWADTIAQVRSAALYFVNITLEHQSVNYLQAGDAATPVQHYWSLSVEEQFYLIWPVLIFVLGAIGGLIRRGHTGAPRWAYGTGLTLVVTASFAWSIHETAVHPAAAYFATFTRIWELGAGGLLAIVYPAVDGALTSARARRLRLPLACCGWLLMVAVAYRYSGSTPFPSWQAAVPVVGAALVIGGAPDLRIYRVRLFKWIGDHSYSIYLWHWPIYTIVKDHDRHTMATGVLTVWQALFIVAATLLLSWVTVRFIENPFRQRRYWRRLVPTYALGASLMAAVLFVSEGYALEFHHRQNAGDTTLARIFSSKNPCLGAGYLDPSHACTLRDIPRVNVPAPLDLAVGNPAWSGGCETPLPALTFVECSKFGDLSAKRTVVVMGDSHADQWVPTLIPIANALKFHLIDMSAEACPGASPPEIEVPACHTWTDQALAHIRAIKPALVVVSLLSMQDFSDATYRRLYTRLLTRLSASAAHVLVIHDDPSPLGAKGEGKADTVGTGPALSTACALSASDRKGPCSAKRSALIYPDPLYALAATGRWRNVAVANLDNFICAPQRCDAVVGGVVVRKDVSHLTPAYAKTLAPYLAPYVANAL